jgi:hypothetical protein
MAKRIVIVIIEFQVDTQKCNAYNAIKENNNNAVCYYIIM